MKTERLSISVINLILIVTLAACNSTTQGNATATADLSTIAPSQPTITAGATTQPTKSSGCANPYFPTSAGATWTYATSSSMAPDNTTKRTITSINATGFTTEDASAPDINVQIQWNCKDGNLAMLQSARITLSNDATVLGITSVDSSGYLIPAVISDGMTWSETLKIIGTGEVNGTTKMIQHNDTQIDCTAAGKESVTVQAGKFDALKVSCVYTITSLTEFQDQTGVSSPVITNETITDWFVVGVGSVKRETVGDISETAVLTSYSIP